jgi:hypothetical protein
MTGMGCSQSKVPVEEVSESSLYFTYVYSVQEPSPAVLDKDPIESIDRRHSVGKLRKSNSSEIGCSLEQERYLQAKSKVDEWFARREEALGSPSAEKPKPLDLSEVESKF